MRGRALFVAAALTLAASFGCSALSAQPILNPQQTWGPASDGMRMAISAVKPGTTTQHDAEFYVAFQNVGSRDRMLNLGFMVGNGKAQQPDAIRLMVTDPKGQMREFQCSKTMFIAGRLDDFVVALPAGATYVLKLSLETYCCLVPPAKMSAGRYRIAARFEGKGAQHLNSDTPGMALMNFWLGTIASNSIDVEISEQPL